MNKMKKARSTAATVEQAAGKAAFSGATISYTDCSTAEIVRQPKIADLLCSGQQNAIPLRDLCHMTGLDARTVRREIEQERRAGIPILSAVCGVTGYFLPSSENETTRFLRSMRGRAREIWRTAAAVESCTKKTQSVLEGCMNG